MEQENGATTDELKELAIKMGIPMIATDEETGITVNIGPKELNGPSRILVNEESEDETLTIGGNLS